MKTNKTIWLTGVGMICLPTLVCAKQNVQQPNILFILCDDMGYGDLACYGQPYIHTPNIDQMAREGMRFTQAYAGSPVSAQSRATIMTGQHTGHTHVRGNKEYWSTRSSSRSQRRISLEPDPAPPVKRGEPESTIAPCPQRSSSPCAS